MTLLLSALAFFGLSAASASDLGARDDYPLGKFRNTYYYMVFEAEYPRATRSESIRTMEGKVIAKVTKKFAKDLLMEGSGKLRDGRVVNWAGRVDGQSRFHVTKHAWGRGSGDCALKPFRTLAADPAQIPPGAVVRIAETVGMRLPDGTRHDGIWRAEDTGSAILHDRIDLYIGKKTYSTYLAAHAIAHLQALTVDLLEAPTPESCVHRTPR